MPERQDLGNDFTDADWIVQTLASLTWFTEDKQQAKRAEYKSEIKRRLEKFGGTLEGLEKWIIDNKAGIRKPSDINANFDWLKE